MVAMPFQGLPIDCFSRKTLVIDSEIEFHCSIGDIPSFQVDFQLIAY